MPKTKLLVGLLLLFQAIFFFSVFFGGHNKPEQQQQQQCPTSSSSLAVVPPILPPPAHLQAAPLEPPALPSSMASRCRLQQLPHGFSAYRSTETPDFDEKFWDRVTAGTWEPATYEVFHALIGANTTYVAFGEYVGSLLLYAAQHARLSVALEPDPSAYARLALNVRCNGQLGSRIVLSDQCIGALPDANTRNVVGGGGGGGGGGGDGVINDTPLDFEYIDFMAHGRSGSAAQSVGHVSQKASGDWKKVTALCVSLPAYLRSLGLVDIEDSNFQAAQQQQDQQPGAGNDWRSRKFSGSGIGSKVPAELFVKIDVEGGESSLVPSFLPWLRQPQLHLAGRKPTLFISMHTQFSKLDSAANADLMSRFLEVLALYPAVGPWGELRPGNQWTAAELAACTRCDILATEMPLVELQRRHREIHAAAAD